jgi:DNA-binding transcriptional regulator YiaG
MKVEKVEVAIYKGESLVCIGKVSECAKKIGVASTTIRYYLTPAYRKRVSESKNSDKWITVIRLDEESVSQPKEKGDVFMREQVTIEEFAEFIYFMRTSIGLSKRAFALALGVTPRTVINWEQSKSIPHDLYPVLTTIRNVVKLRIKNNRLSA